MVRVPRSFAKRRTGNATASYFSGGKLWLVAFPPRSGIIPAKPYPDVSYALLYQATG
jgi:hypothetical protein